MAIRYRKFGPGEYVMQVKNGRTIREGLGLSVLYDTKRTSLLAVPVTALDADLVFEDLLTADFQSCCAQGCVTFRFHSCPQAASMLDFTWNERASIQLENRSEVLRAARTRLEQLAGTALVRELARLDIRTALKSADTLAEAVCQALREHPMVRELGVQILSVTLTGLSARPETRRTLEAAAREQILREQDDAVYLRRNAAIEQERLVRENELDTEIRVAEKAREKQERELATRRFVQEQELELERERLERRIDLEERSRALVEAEVENQSRRDRQRAEAAAELLKAFDTVRPQVLQALSLSGLDSGGLIARAFLALGENAQKIGTLNISPELLEALTGKGERNGPGNA